MVCPTVLQNLQHQDGQYRTFHEGHGNYGEDRTKWEEASNGEKESAMRCEHRTDCDRESGTLSIRPKAHQQQTYGHY
jgi:hypothetical protein